MIPGDIVYIDTSKAFWLAAYARKPFVVRKVGGRILIEWATTDHKQHTRAGSNFARFWCDRQYLKGFSDDEQTAQDDATHYEQEHRPLL